jgi:hypothetical protein
MIGLTSEQVARLIEQGETDRVEFKTRLATDSIAAQVFSAFSNSQGGILLVGVSEAGEATGVPPEEVLPTLERLSAVANSMLPTPADIGVVEVAGKKVIYAIIERSPSEYGAVLSSSGLAYQRSGAGSSVVSPLGFYTTPTVERIEAAKPKGEILLLVAMSFRDEEEPHLQDYYRAIVRAAQETDLPIRVTRIDLVEGDYEISQEIMDQIDAADILLADFTLSPSNVYFELGYARGTETRVLQTARKGTPLEFDIRNWRTTFYRNATGLQEKLVPELKAAYSEVAT